MLFKKGDLVMNIDSYSHLGAVEVEEDSGGKFILVHTPNYCGAHDGEFRDYKKRDKAEYLFFDRKLTRLVERKNPEKNKVKHNEESENMSCFHISKEIYSDKYTIVILRDGRKGVAKCHPDDEFNKHRGFEIAFAKALLKEPRK